MKQKGSFTFNVNFSGTTQATWYSGCIWKGCNSDGTLFESVNEITLSEVCITYFTT